MQKRRLTLLTALLLSVLLHLLAAGGGLIPLPVFFSQNDEVLERKQAPHVQQVQLVATPPAPTPRPLPPGLRMTRATPPQPQPEPAAAPAPEPEPPAPEEQTPEAAERPAPAPTDEALAPEAPAAEAVPAPEALPPPPQPAPSFPVQLDAQLDARISGIPVMIHQTWVMEGYRYFITQQARKFGFRLAITSEGRISPEGGLSPERSQMQVNDKVKSFSEYAAGMLRYGKPSNPRQDPLPVIPQDLASLPFHVAVTFNGQPQSFFITTGRKVYQIRIGLEAEEKIRLPVGVLRTLHLYAERFDDELRTMVRDYEIWLAPDYLNFPVKVLGFASDGTRFEYRVQSLEIEGKLVLGKKADMEKVAPDEAIPEWLQEQAEEKGLNNP